MNKLPYNELLGTVAIQSALVNSTSKSLSLGKVMLVLPLLFDKSIRSLLKNKNSVVLSSKDLLLSNPTAFSTVSHRYSDLTITSLNAILLSCEIGMARTEDDSLKLINPIYSLGNKEIGKAASDMLAAGPKLGLILSEDVSDLYQTFRIEL